MTPILPRRGDDEREKPDVQGARERLARARRQRPDVEALVEALKRERRLNNFTANVTATLRGGR